MLRRARLRHVVERLRHLRSHRGSVMVMVAAGLPAFVLLTAFAVDVAHFFDYSRNLQNRADAAALAAGAQFGATCFASTPSQALMDGIGMTAQQYSGPPSGTPDGNLPYTQAQMTTAGQQPYYNQPNLTKGTPGNYHVLLNAKDYYPNGTDWAMGTVCSATDENGVTAPMVDVRVTQANLGLFFPLIKVQPNISAHARVELEGAAGSGIVTPIAVRDSNVTCLEANFIDTRTGNPITTTPASPVPLTKEGQDSSNGATIWDLPSGMSLTMPATAGDNVYVQLVANDCNNGTPINYDSNSGVLLINNYPTSTPGTLPAIDTGGVVLTGTCSPDQYFSTSDCSVNVTAHVAFPSGATSEQVTAVDHYTDPGSGTATTQSVTLSNSSGSTWTSNNALTIVDSTAATPVFNTGRHQIEITWSYVPNGGGPAVTGTSGIQQQAFSACDSAIDVYCADPNDSGPIQLAQLSTCNTSPCTTGGSGANAFAVGTTHNLDLVVETGTISDATPGRPPTILRFSEQGANQSFTSHATGLINCGQGSGNSGAIQAVVTGCPAAGTSACPALSTNSYFDYCAPLAINKRNDVCTPAGNQLGSSFTARTLGNPGVPVDCFQTVGGSKSPIPQGIACRIIAGSSVNNSGCVTPPGSNVCSSNNWSTSDGGKYISAGDPRAMVMAISAPEDLSKNNEIVPIHNFGVFYVTGWDTKGSMGKYSCGSYEAPPNDSSGNPAPVENSNDTVSNPLQGEVWGYWIKDTIPYAIPSGTPCDPALFGACTPALTR